MTLARIRSGQIGLRIVRDCLRSCISIPPASPRRDWGLKTDAGEMAEIGQ